MMGTVWSIWRAETTELLRSPVLWTAGAVHLALLGAVIWLSWPSTYGIGQAQPPATLAWWGYVETLAVLYFGLAIAGQALAGQDPIQPREWMGISGVRVSAVILARVATAITTTCFFLLTAAPLAVLAWAAGPITIDRFLLFLGALGLWLLASSLIGGLVAILLPNKPTRSIIIDSLLVLIILGTTVAETSLRTTEVVGTQGSPPLGWNPFLVTADILGSPGSALVPTSWLMHFGVYMSIGLAAAALTAWRLHAFQKEGRPSA